MVKPKLQVQYNHAPTIVKPFANQHKNTLVKYYKKLMVFAGAKNSLFTSSHINMLL